LQASATAETLVSVLWADFVKASDRRWTDRYKQDAAWLTRPPCEDRRPGVLWPLLKKRVGDIDVHTIRRWAAEAAVAPAQSTANLGRGSELRKGFTIFRAFWAWAASRDEYAGVLADPRLFADRDLRATISKPGAKSDVLSREQLSPWFAAVRQLRNRVISAYLQTLLMTGARRRELSSLTWEEVDFQWSKMHLPDKIEEEGRLIPLTPYVSHLLSSLPRRNKYVFSSPSSESGRLEEPRLAHRRALEAAGLPRELSLHGLRRSFATLSEWIEAPSGVIAQLMGHHPSAVAEKHYHRRPLDLLATWSGRYEAWILEQAKIAFDPSAAKKATGLHVV
jgi:integrase